MNLQEILEKIKHIPSNVVDEDTTMHVKYLSNLPDVPLIQDGEKLLFLWLLLARRPK